MNTPRSHHSYSALVARTPSIPLGPIQGAGIINLCTVWSQRTWKAHLLQYHPTRALRSA